MLYTQGDLAIDNASDHRSEDSRFSFWLAQNPFLFPGSSAVKHLPAMQREAGNVDSISELGRSPGGGHSNPLQHSCLGNPRDRGALWVTLCGVAKSRTRHSTHVCTD